MVTRCSPVQRDVLRRVGAEAVSKEKWALGKLGRLIRRQRPADEPQPKPTAHGFITKLQRHILEKSSAVIHFEPGEGIFNHETEQRTDLLEIWEAEGLLAQYKNRWEIGHSGTAVEADERAGWEQAIFYEIYGRDKHAPRYGGLSFVPQASGYYSSAMAACFGPFYLMLKREVLAHACTVTFGDTGSLADMKEQMLLNNQTPDPVAMGVPDCMALAVAGLCDCQDAPVVLAQLYKIMEGDGGDTILDTTFEVQIHQSIYLSRDVEGLMVPTSAKQNVKNRLRSLCETWQLQISFNEYDDP